MQHCSRLCETASRRVELWSPPLAVRSAEGDVRSPPLAVRSTVLASLTLREATLRHPDSELPQQSLRRPHIALGISSLSSACCPLRHGSVHSERGSSPSSRLRVASTVTTEIMNGLVSYTVVSLARSYSTAVFVCNPSSRCALVRCYRSLQLIK